MQAGSRRAAAGPCGEARQVFCGTGRVRQPGEPVPGVLPRIGQDALSHVLGISASLRLLLDEPGHGQRGIGAHTSVVIHVQHPHVVAVLVLTDPQLMRIVASTCLEPRSVRGAILPRHGDQPDQVASGRQPGDPACCLAALVDDDVDPESRKAPGQIGKVGQGRALEPRVGVVPAYGGDDNDQEIVASRQSVARPASS